MLLVVKFMKISLEKIGNTKPLTWDTGYRVSFQYGDTLIFLGFVNILLDIDSACGLDWDFIK